MSARRRNRQRTPDEDEWIEAFHEALVLVEDETLPLSDDDASSEAGPRRRDRTVQATPLG